MLIKCYAVVSCVYAYDSIAYYGIKFNILNIFMWTYGFLSSLYVNRDYRYSANWPSLSLKATDSVGNMLQYFSLYGFHSQKGTRTEAKCQLKLPKLVQDNLPYTITPIHYNQLSFWTSSTAASFLIPSYHTSSHVAQHPHAGSHGMLNVDWITQALYKSIMKLPPITSKMALCLVSQGGSVSWGLTSKTPFQRGLNLLPCFIQTVTVWVHSLSDISVPITWLCGNFIVFLPIS